MANKRAVTFAIDRQAPAARRYKVDLASQQACCEANYARLLKLMPTFNEQDQWTYDVQAGAKFWQIRLRVTERARYTTMLEVTQHSGSQDDGLQDRGFQDIDLQDIDLQDNGLQSSGLQQWGSSPNLQVRLYHDASMAEVVAWQGHCRLRPRYDYPNPNMYQRDEKAQFNRFLEDWLSYSLAHGRSCQVV